MEHRVGWSLQSKDLKAGSTDLYRGLQALAGLGFGIAELPLEAITPGMVGPLAESAQRLGLRLAVAVANSEPLSRPQGVSKLLGQLRCAALVVDARAIPGADARASWVRLANTASTQLAIDAAIDSGRSAPPEISYFHAASTTGPDASPSGSHPLTYARVVVDPNNTQSDQGLDVHRWAHDLVDRNYDGPIIVRSADECAPPGSAIALVRALLRRIDKLEWVRYQ